MKIPAVKTKDLLTVNDFSHDEIIKIFKLAKKLKRQTIKGKTNNILKNKTLAMIFEKSSTRTRVSFETGIFQLGGHALFLSTDDIQLGRGESISHTASVLSRYVDGIMIRTFSQEKIIELAEYSRVPVINGLTDSAHPCQALSDFFTIYELYEDLRNLKFTYIGDGNNVANSLLLCSSILGVDISIASPKGYMPEKGFVEKALQISSRSGSKVEITNDIGLAVEKTNFLYTDVWVSMGQEKEVKKRKKALAKYKISKELLKKCSPGCKVMHCLPAHLGEEIDEDVFNSENSIIYDQAENRLHLQKAILCVLMKKNKRNEV